MTKDELDKFIEKKNKIKNLIMGQFNNDEIEGPQQPVEEVETKEIEEVEPVEPTNNNGRQECFWCGRKTITINGFLKKYDYCESCQK
jgi:hypothetical protein